MSRHATDYLPDLPERDALLARLGLQQRRSPVESAARALGVFGGGLLIGYGLARLLAPRPSRPARPRAGNGHERVRPEQGPAPPPLS